MDFVLACYHLKNKGYAIQVKFVGKIHNVAIVDTVQRAIVLLGLRDQVIFTDNSVKINEIKEKEEYYFNLSIGDFVGYSSIECIESGLKTLFYNIDDNLEKIANNKFMTVSSFSSLCEKLEQIHRDRKKYDEIIKNENLELRSSYYLNDEDELQLKKILQ
ncbi:MAG: hypothetical protein LBP34_02040 [Flavobacteriaceae bacterium]|nr:hypothetical protein [Flavobacteriaceae bacterium]